jgi:hypothetical protein
MVYMQRNIKFSPKRKIKPIAKVKPINSMNFDKVAHKLKLQKDIVYNLNCVICPEDLK